MTDDRNSGIPPAQGHAPPPLAPPPAPVPPPYQPAPAPMPYPVARSGPGLWPLFTVLAFLVGVGGTILTLWLTGDLWNSRPSVSSSTFAGGSTGGGLNPGPGMNPPAGVAPPGPATTGGTAPTPATLPGSWGPNCPDSADEALTFYPDGTASGDGENGTWSLDGNFVTLNNGRETLTLHWEMVGSDSARVRRAGDSQARIVNRCS